MIVISEEKLNRQGKKSPLWTKRSFIYARSAGKYCQRIVSVESVAITILREIEREIEAKKEEGLKLLDGLTDPAIHQTPDKFQT